MKHRYSFVSNSSSTSFLIIGLDYVPEDILRKEGMDEDSDFWFHYGCEVLDSGFHVYGSGGVPYYIGIPVEDALNSDKTVSELKSQFQKMFLDIYEETIPYDKIKMHYGEIGN